ncbi:hypothetical protein WDC_0108 [Paucilactobacillus wasatchensis]|uniref:Uncharacterized protein n=1 Tax=Paucilactobacillus wasatchensis TaxID=1335616 RepID=A0A0D0Y7Y3_9LACO|nr:hypothetical protein WDC_0108 [Paucilactobacillus wasatchensis]
MYSTLFKPDIEYPQKLDFTNLKFILCINSGLNSIIKIKKLMI